MVNIEKLIRESLERMKRKYKWFSNERQFEGLFVAECYLIMNENNENYKDFIIYPEYSFFDNNTKQNCYCDVAFIDNKVLTPLEIKFKTKETTITDCKGNPIHCGKHTNYKDGKVQCFNDLKRIKANKTTSLSVGSDQIESSDEGYFLLLSENFSKNGNDYIKNFVDDAKIRNTNWENYSEINCRKLQFLLVIV